MKINYSKTLKTLTKQTTIILLTLALLATINPVNAMHSKKTYWTEEENQSMQGYVKDHQNQNGSINWKHPDLARIFPNRSIISIQKHYLNTLKPAGLKIPISPNWSNEEIQKMKEYINVHSECNHCELKGVFPNKSLDAIKIKFNELKLEKDFTQRIKESTSEVGEIDWQAVKKHFPDNSLFKFLIQEFLKQNQSPQEESSVQINSQEINTTNAYLVNASWNNEEIQTLKDYVRDNQNQNGFINWKQQQLKDLFYNRSLAAIQTKYYANLKPDNQKNGVWSNEEAQKLKEYINTNLPFNSHELQGLFPNKSLNAIKIKFNKLRLEKDFSKYIKENTSEFGKIDWNAIKKYFKNINTFDFLKQEYLDLKNQSPQELSIIQRNSQQTKTTNAYLDLDGNVHW